MGAGRATLGGVARARSFINSILAVTRAVVSFRSRRWWAMAPFLPIPDSKYLDWRMYTAFGNHTARPTWSDLVDYATWRQQLAQYRKVAR